MGQYSNYKFIVLENIFETLESSLTSEYLAKIFKARKAGYSSRHNSEYLPFGMEDFLASQIAICKKVDGEWIPICICKIFDTKMCKKYEVAHPIIYQMKDQYSEFYCAYIKKKIKDTNELGIRSSYTGGFTMDRRYLESKEEANLLKEMYCAFHTYYHIDRNLDMTYGFTAINLKTDKLYAKWGGEPILLDDKPETAFTKGANQPVTPSFINFRELNTYALEMMEKFKELWQDRIDNKGFYEETLTEISEKTKEAA